jgi:crotonobetainyl-CoA:carnitine CoA-transferase CaiB-like acyl-CoA transferase
LSDQAATGALAGLRVLDLTVMLAGPFCTMLLADLGADVIKVESPQGDTTRIVGPFFADDTRRDFGGYFQSINRNKRGIVLDLKTPDGCDALLKLVANADVLVENYRVGVMDRLGLAYERLREANPRLVYASITGFGHPRSGKSPYVDWPAYDVVAQAMGGIIAITGPGAGEPTKVGPGVGDMVPAMLLAVGILAAVRHAERTGEGQFIDIAMYDAILALCERSIYQHSYQGVVPGPEGNGHPLLCPFGLFEAADGFVSIACPHNDFWVALCDAIGRPELGADPRYASNAARMKRRTEVNDLVGAWTKVRSKREIALTFGGRVPAGPVNHVGDIWNDPHVAARNMLAKVEQPGSARQAVIANSPLRLSLTPAGVRHRAPLFGEHTAEVLGEAGVPYEGKASARTEVGRGKKG